MIFDRIRDKLMAYFNKIFEDGLAEIVESNRSGRVVVVALAGSLLLVVLQVRSVGAWRSR